MRRIFSLDNFFPQMNDFCIANELLIHVVSSVFDNSLFRLNNQGQLSSRKSKNIRNQEIQIVCLGKVWGHLKNLKSVFDVMCRFCGFKKKRKVKFFSFHSLEHFTAKTRSVKRLKFLVSCSISRASIRKSRPEIWLKESDKRSRVPWKQTNASKKAGSFFVYYIFQALFNPALARRCFAYL